MTADGAGETEASADAHFVVSVSTCVVNFGGFAAGAGARREMVCIDW